MDEIHTVIYMISVIQSDMNELAEAERLEPHSDFRTGQMYAYAECLELLQLCSTFRDFGLDFEIEKRYPLK